MRLARRRDDRGASAVEFALIMVPLFVILFGLIQYGLYFWSMQGGADVARSAARLAAVGDPVACAGVNGFEAKILNQIDDIGETSGAIIHRTYENAPPNVEIGDTVTVQIEFKSIDLGLPFVPFIKHGWVSQKAQARVDYLKDGEQPEEC